MKELQDKNQQRLSWPHGVVDDSTNDDKVLNHMSAEEKAAAGEAPITKWTYNHPEAVVGQWPPGQFEQKDGTVVKYGHVDDGTDDDTIMNAQTETMNLVQAAPNGDAVKPMNYYLNNPSAVPRAQPGQWPIGKSTDKWGVTTTYGRKDDGTDDHTVLNAQVTDTGVRMVQEPMEHYLNHPNAVPQAVVGQWPVGQFTDKWGVVHRYGTKDDGTDDHTVLNAQKESGTMVFDEEHIHV